MKERNSESPSVGEVDAILKTLNNEEQRAYVHALYSIAKAALHSCCSSVKIADAEIIEALERKSDANFEEWVHSCIISSGL